MTDTYLSPESIKEALGFAGRLADAAWMAIAPHFRALDGVENKLAAEPGASFDPVTEADQAAERAMRALIGSERPEDGVQGEEYDDDPSKNGFNWVLDPIDGTRAFVAGLPVWTTLIALCGPDGVPIIGMIDQPVLGERYLGWPGGAVLEKAGMRTPLGVSGQTDLRKSVIATTDPFIMNPAEQGAWTHLRHTAQIVRYGLDAYAYARLAAGTIDLVAEGGLQPYDAAALIPVVRGAGGLACNWRGEPAMPGGQLVCAATQDLLDQALISLRRSVDRAPES
jgi:histidinol phosphatase-like enzyme (inositol monophosphatase family)